MGSSLNAPQTHGGWTSLQVLTVQSLVLDLVLKPPACVLRFCFHLFVLLLCQSSSSSSSSYSFFFPCFFHDLYTEFHLFDKCFEVVFKAVLNKPLFVCLTSSSETFSLAERFVVHCQVQSCTRRS